MTSFESKDNFAGFPLAKQVNDFHVNDDVDSDTRSHHHTLGTGRNQAARGSDFEAALGRITNLEGLVAALEDLILPVGHVIMVYGPAPTGYLLCDGSAFSGVTYPDLATLLGSTNTPDLRDRLPVGASGTKALGSTGGSDTQTLVTSNLPTIPVRYANDAATTGSSPVTRVLNVGGLTGAGGGMLANLGASTAFNIQNKYLALNFAIKAI